MPPLRVVIAVWVVSVFSGVVVVVVQCARVSAATAAVVQPFVRRHCWLSS